MVLSLIVNMSVYQNKFLEKLDWYWAILFLPSIKTDRDGWWTATLQKLIMGFIYIWRIF